MMYTINWQIHFISMNDISNLSAISISDLSQEASKNILTEDLPFFYGDEFQF